MARHQKMICDECEESQAFPKDIVELESTLGIPRDQLTAEMEKGRRCIVCGSTIEEKVPAGLIKKTKSASRLQTPLEDQ